MINNAFRFFPIEDQNEQKYRNEYRRDYARVLHSPSFRRLEHKTQLFPGHESDFFRNRLTHCLEVAQISKSLALKIKNEYPYSVVEPDVCEIAGLMHDLGHPPFGHNGEHALDQCMIHFGGFEGNAQTLRIICRLEKKEINEENGEPLCVTCEGKDIRTGLNLTARTIASAIKYDKVIPISREKKRSLVKGYYRSEKSMLDKIKEELGCKGAKNFKTIECSIMDLADDIAYSTYDMEDAFKAGFLTPLEMMAVEKSVLNKIIVKLEKDGIHKTVDDCRIGLYEIFNGIWQEAIDQQKCVSANDALFEEYTLATVMSIYKHSKNVAAVGYSRTKFTSGLVNEFIEGVEYVHNKNNPLLSTVRFNSDIKFKVNLLKHFTYEYLINSPRLKVVENRGEEIIDKIFKRLASEGGEIFLPQDFQTLYNTFTEDVDKKRVICDFIAGMTDRYALEFYGRLYSENPQTIFKPL